MESSVAAWTVSDVHLQGRILTIQTQVQMRARHLHYQQQ